MDLTGAPPTREPHAKLLPLAKDSESKDQYLLMGKVRTSLVCRFIRLVESVGLGTFTSNKEIVMATGKTIASTPGKASAKPAVEYSQQAAPPRG